MTKTKETEYKDPRNEIVSLDTEIRDIFVESVLGKFDQTKRNLLVGQAMRNMFTAQDRAGGYSYLAGLFDRSLGEIVEDIVREEIRKDERLMETIKVLVDEGVERWIKEEAEANKESFYQRLKGFITRVFDREAGSRDFDG
jgi:hypothetical protein